MQNELSSSRHYSGTHLDVQSANGYMTIIKSSMRYSLPNKSTPWNVMSIDAIYACHLATIPKSAMNGFMRGWLGLLLYGTAVRNEKSYSEQELLREFGSCESVLQRMAPCA